MENIIFINRNFALSDRKDTVQTTYDHKTTISEVFDKVGEPYAEIKLSNYYIVGYEYCGCSRDIPYIIEGDEVKWFKNYNDVKVIDFIITHKIKDKSIEVYTGIPQAGGPDFFPIIEIWNSVYPYLDQIGTIFGVSCGVIGFGKWLQKKFKNKVTPTTLFDFLISRDMWNHFELASYLQIEPEEAKNILKGFGFEWNQKVQLYCITDKTEDICNNLKKIRHHTG